MSTRLYPLYQKGNPQLRVFLPNFWLKLVKPEIKQPPNVVVFKCSMEMTKYDVGNYLEKIYNVKYIDIWTKIAMGKTRPEPGKGYIIKDDDIKYAYVILPKDQKFEFPNLFPTKDEIITEYEKTLDILKEAQEAQLVKNNDRPGVPGWFTF